MVTKKFFLILLFSLSLASSLQADCWDVEERKDIELAEMEENMILSFKSAKDCKALSGAAVSLQFNNYAPVQTTTDQNGYLLIPTHVLEKVQDGKLHITLTKNGYIPYELTLPIEMGSLWKKYFLIAPRTNPKAIRFVLSWDKDPRDLDLHLVSNDFHISYRNKKSITQRVQLDQDAQHGYGAETITLLHPSKKKEYRLYVDKYAGNGNIDNKAVIDLYIDNKLIKQIKLPQTSHRSVFVLSIKNNQVTYQNTPTATIK